MKTRIALLLIMALTMAGCIREDRSDCPPPSNVKIGFRYLDSYGADKFNERISSVHVTVFDMNGRSVYNRQINKSSLSRFRGDNLHLDPGTYRVVCWGNIEQYSQMNPVLYNGMHFSDSYVQLDVANGHLSSDPVMYAPRPGSFTRALGNDDIFRITVPESGSVEETIDFFSAHTEFNIIVKGLEDYSGADNIAPEVEVDNLPTGYDFDRQPTSGSTTYKNTTQYVTTSKGPEARAHFYTGHFGQTRPITVKLFSGVDGRQLESIDLPTYLGASGTNIADMLERSILITIEYLPMQPVKITVKVSPWNGTGVSPIL